MLSSSSLADDVSSANPDGVLPAFFLCTDESDSFVHLSLKNPSVARGIAPGLMELRFKWAREKMEDAEFYESLEQMRDLDSSIRESEGEGEEEYVVETDEVQPRSISLPKRKGKFKYKIYELELSDPKWGEVADKIHEAEEEADWREAKPVTGKCKLVMEKLESLEEKDDHK
ncbi:hypothetical protein Bca101_054355 [Brassica carinata]